MPAHRHGDQPALRKEPSNMEKEQNNGHMDLQELGG